jgi:penicillin-binding protein 1C
MKFTFKGLMFRVGIVFVTLLAVYLALRLTPYPELDTFLVRPFSTRVYDRNRVLLQIVPLEGGMRREYVPYDVLEAGGITKVFVEAEDERFYYHLGVDPVSIARAAFQNIGAGRRVSGASTITMQLARIIAANSGGGLGRKIAEAVNALRLEARFTKKEILQMYLNSTPFGFQTEGLASAARNFFSAEADMLTPAQIFCLAVIPRRPSLYSPLLNPVECKNAGISLQKKFLRSSTNREKFPAFAAITDGDWDFTVEHAKRFDYPFEAPHLVRYVLGTAPVYGKTETSATRSSTEFCAAKLQDRLGPGRQPAELKLSVDIYLQRYIEALIAENTARYSTERVNQGAAVVLDNGTGEVLAWVGSSAFGGGDGGQIDGVLALNQPGSSMKPFLYALALERGLVPNTVLADVPVSFGGGEIYIPQNFNNRFNGPVLLRQALASSLNIPAVQLLYRLGVKDYADFLSRLGFVSGGEEGFSAAGLGLALGNVPVSLVEMARAFSVFPNDGKLLDVEFLFKGGQGESDGNGTLPAESVISPDTARVVCAFLSDKGARYLAFGRARNFTADFPLIVKTGTANQYQSITALAASRRFTGAVWMGNFSGETVVGKTGSSVPAAIVRDSLVFLHENYARPGTPESLAFREPEGYPMRPVCALSGLSPTEACMTFLYEYTDPLSTPPPCDWHRAENGRVTVNYPAGYQNWLLSSRREGELEHSGSELAIVTPRDGFVFFAYEGGENDAIPVEVIGGASDELQIFYDGVNRTVRRPFRFFLPLERGRHTLAVRCGGETHEVEFTVE